MKYVQHKIASMKEEFVDLISRDETTVFICGDAKGMATDVQATIINCFKEVQGLTDQEARKKIAEMTVAGRYKQDIWA